MRIIHVQPEVVNAICTLQFVSITLIVLADQYQGKSKLT